MRIRDGLMAALVVGMLLLFLERGFQLDPSASTCRVSASMIRCLRRSSEWRPRSS